MTAASGSKTRTGMPSNRRDGTFKQQTIVTVFAEPFVLGPDAALLEAHDRGPGMFTLSRCKASCSP